MKFRKPWILIAGSGALLVSAQLMAQQDMPPPPPPPPAPQAPMPPPPPEPPAPPADPMAAGQDMPAPPSSVAPQSPPTPPADPSMMPTQNGSAAADGGAVFQTPQGEVTVRSSMAPAPAEGAPPPFEQLAGGSKWITEEQAAVYPLLANDFDYADRNGDHRISAKEYASWSHQE